MSGTMSGGREKGRAQGQEISLPKSPVRKIPGPNILGPKIPGLTAEGQWDLPGDLNMAMQVLDHPASQLAIRDLTGEVAQDVTYGALQQMVDGLARYLQQRVQAGDRVGVLLSQSPWCVASHLAIWKIGAISVPLFKLFQHDALASRILDAGVALVLTDRQGAAQLGDLAKAVLAAEAGLDGPTVVPAATTPETPAILIYTSGTTGRPKGALHGHRVLTGHLPGVWLSHDHLGQEGDCLWTPADWAWIGGLFDVALAGLALGVPVVAARLEKFSVSDCLDVIARGAVRNVFFPPTALRVLKAAADQVVSGHAVSGHAVSGQGLRALRTVASGGEPLGAEVLAWGEREMGLTINEFYGQTECNMVVSSCAAAFPVRPGCMGKAVPGYELAILDADGASIGADAVEGDVAIRKGPAAMMLGYWNQPEATAGKFRGDWLLTGDRGLWEAGYLRFLGREDDVITSGGYRIGPGEIEDCLLTHPAVATVGVVGKPDPLRTELVKAYVVLRPGVEVSGAELQDYVKARLARYSYPREVAFVDALPMTVTGKVIRNELKRRAAAELEGNL